MTPIEYLSLIFIVSTFAFMVLLAYVMPVHTGKQLYVVVFYVLISISTLFGGMHLLGKAKPIEYNVGLVKAEVHSYYFIEGEAIWLWVLVDDSDGAPVYYKLPWSDENAARLKEKYDGAQEQGGELRILLDPANIEDLFKDESLTVVPPPSTPKRY